MKEREKRGRNIQHPLRRTKHVSINIQQAGEVRVICTFAMSLANVHYRDSRGVCSKLWDQIQDPWIKLTDSVRRFFFNNRVR